MASHHSTSPLAGPLKVLGNILGTLLILGTLAVLAVFAINIAVIASTSDDLWQSHELKNKNADYIVVLGAGLDADGHPSPMLEERLNKGIELYRLKAGQKILLSGDNDRAYYDEVKAMKRYLEAKNIDAKAIVTDPDGSSTYASMSRLEEAFDANSVIVVSQKYHLYRALFIAEHAGLKCYGIPADVHPWAGRADYGSREFWARVKDFGQVYTENAPAPLRDAYDALVDKGEKASRDFI